MTDKHNKVAKILEPIGKVVNIIGAVALLYYSYKDIKGGE